MSTDISKLFSNLQFDKLEMEGSLAHKYFKENHNSFGKESKDYVIDTVGNKIYSCQYDTESYKWDQISHEYKRDFFTKLAVDLAKNVQLLAEIDYFIRGIPVGDSKKGLLDMIELCESLSNMASIPFNQLPWYKNKNSGVFKNRYYMTNISSIYVLSHALCGLAALKPVNVIVENNTALLVHYFNTILNSCDSKGYFPSIGPYYDREDKEPIVRTGCSLIVCKSGDLDSAADTAIRGAWSYRGLLPNAVKRILVQDNVWDQFVDKLSMRLKEFKWNFPSSYTPDNETKKVIQNTNAVYEKAVDDGQTVLKMNDFFYDSANNDGFLKPLVIMDEKPYFWEELPKDYTPLVVTLQSFRTSKEALLLLNKYPLGHLSIWCNNASICNELAFKVNIKKVCINSFGLNDLKAFGSRVAYVEVFTNLIDLYPADVDGTLPSGVCKSRDEAEKELANFHTKWLALPKDKITSILYQAHQHIQQNDVIFERLLRNGNMKYKNDDFKIDLKESEYLLNNFTNSNDVLHKANQICLQINKPLGVVNIVNGAEYNGCMVTIFGALLAGNAVFLETTNEFLKQVVNAFVKFNIPVVAVAPECWNSSSENGFHTTNAFAQSKLCLNIFTKSNYIWYTYGESFYDAKTMNVVV